MTVHSPETPLAQSDSFERRSRLVSLVYEVLRDIETPTDDARSMAMELSRAFSDKATALANLKAAGPKAQKSELPARIESTWAAFPYRKHQFDRGVR
jgi:hypothetical protein